MTRTLMIAMLAAALAVAACGGDEVSAGEEQAAAEARSLSQELRAIEKRVRDDLAELGSGGATSARAERALDDAADRARAVADRARDELPEDSRARGEIEQAARQLAEAAETPEEARAALDGARQGLEDLRRSLGGSFAGVRRATTPARRRGAGGAASRSAAPRA
jgi:hypothetical protein